MASMGAYNGHSGEKRDRVLKWMKQQYASGAIPRATRCCACGQTRGHLQGHHEDYDRPGSHVEICVTCHLVLHNRFRRPAMFDEYRARIRSGWQAPPLTQKAAWGALARGILAGNYPEGHYVRKPVRSTFLDTLSGPQRLDAPGDLEE